MTQLILFFLFLIHNNAFPSTPPSLISTHPRGPYKLSCIGGRKFPPSFPINVLMIFKLIRCQFGLRSLQMTLWYLFLNVWLKPKPINRNGHKPFFNEIMNALSKYFLCFWGNGQVLKILHVYQ